MLEMVDQSEKGSSESEEMSSGTSTERVLLLSGGGGNQIKTCADCGTSKTPLWRGGPAGPKSLCNACGIKSRKRRRAILGTNKEDNKKSRKASPTNTSNTQNQTQKDQNQMRKVLDIGREVVFQRPRSRSTTASVAMKQKRKWGEEEQAAYLLMALSCGSVFA